MKERYVRILDILSNSKSVKVTLLAEMMDVSHVTLRKDLDILEDKGIIIRTHGYASLDGADNTGKRIAVNYSIKKRIAKAAAETVEDGETIMLESGSCCALFAEELALCRKNVTIVTNSAFIANYICKLDKIKIILFGGYFQPESHVMVGPMTAKCAEMFFTDKFFLGADGCIQGQGFTGRDHLRAETAAELAKHANKVFILTESAKFNRRGAYSLIKFDKVSGVFTDDGISKKDEEVLLQNNIQFYKVSSVNERLQLRHFPGQPPFLFTEKRE